MNTVLPRTLLPSLCLVLISACSAGDSDQAPVSDGGSPAVAGDSSEWQSLFDGETLSGWRGYKGESAPSGWVVEGGALSLGESGGGDIMTVDAFSDFELEFEWRISAGGNSGVIYLVNETADADHTFQTGPEYQVLDDGRHSDGQDEKHRAGSLYDLVAPSASAARPVGEYNQARIVLHDGRIEHWLNGVKIVESPYGNAEWRTMVAGSKFAAMPEFGTFARGHIALQDHGDKVWYRNIRIRELRAAEPTQASAGPPNVVLIFADDLGYGDIHCESCDSPTPRLDELAQQGARLTSFYTPTPYCAPSRASLLTGRYPFRHSLVRNPAPDSGLSNFGLPLEEITIAELLKGAGYKTAMFGKWHLGHRPQWLPSQQGFDEYLSILYSNDMKPVQLVEADRVVEYPVDQSTLTQRYTQRAIDFISTHRDKPFFVYLPYAMPHKPLAASEDYYTPETPDDLYADVVRELDGSVGRILDALDEMGLADNTLVIFTSDNGPYFGGSTGGLRGMKGRSWEGGVRVPFIARYPGRITAGAVNDAPAGVIDMLPTIAAYVGLALPDDRVIDGHDIRALLEDPGAPGPHEAIYTMRGAELATIRMGPWKLHVRNPGPPRGSELSDEEKASWVDPRGPDGVHIIAPAEQYGPLQYPGVEGGDTARAMMLFNLDDDPAEQHDVADAHPDVVARLKQAYDETVQQVPEFTEAPTSYLLKDPPPGERRPFMKLLGGDLRYDRVAEDQQHLLLEADD